jgi:hypothetical protein
MPLTLYGGGQSVIQVATTTFDSLATTSSSGAPNSISNGLQIFAINFTPLSATSNILVQTSTIKVGEESNNGNVCWISLWYGNTFVAANSGTGSYLAFNNNLNTAYLSFNHIYPSWGTSTQTVQVRAGMDNGTAYINGQGYTQPYSGNTARLSMSIMEIATS